MLEAAAQDSLLQVYADRLKWFRDRDVLSRILLSHDGNSFPRGRAIRPYDALLGRLVPYLLEQGFSELEVEQLLVKNPRAAFQTRGEREMGPHGQEMAQT